MKVMIGQLLGLSSSERSNPANGNTWIEHTAHVLDGVNSIRVTLQGPSRDGRQPGLDPATLAPLVNEVIALEVYDRGHTNGRVYTTARRVVTADDLADALRLAHV